MLAFCLLSSAPQAHAQDITTGLVGHWTLDETSGALADSSGNGNNGTAVNGPQYASAGKIGYGMNFVTGVNDYVDIASDASHENLGPMTISAWVYPRTIDECPVVAKIPATEHWVFRLTDSGSSDDAIQFIYEFDGGDMERESVDFAIQLNEWQHVAVTYDGGTAFTGTHLYRNGTELAYATEFNGSGSHDDSGNTVKIGHAPGWGDCDAIIDDVRIYSRILTADDIAELAAATHPGELRYNTNVRTAEYHDGYDWIAMGPEGVPTQGLVGHWKLDEASGTLVDSSGNGYDGTQSGGVGYSSAGMIGTSVHCNGVDANVQFPDLPVENTDLTFSIWINSEDLTTDENTLISTPSANDFLFRTTTGAGVEFRVLNDTKETAGGLLTIGKWHHVAVVYDRSAMDATIYIDGAAVPNALSDEVLDFPFDDNSGAELCSRSNGNDETPGNIDDVRIYNRALSASEVAALYDYGLRDDGLVAHWPLDESGGTTAQDIAGDNDGAASGGVLFGSAGQVGLAAEFDGVDDRVLIGDLDVLDDTDFTLAAWVRPNDLSADEATIIAKYHNDEHRYTFRIGTDGSLWFYTRDQGECPASINENCEKRTAANIVLTDVWTHVTAVYDFSENDVTLYANGVEVAPSAVDETFVSNLTNIDDPVVLGRRQDDSDELNGNLDDVRIYNRALSEPEINEIYQNGLLGHAAPSCAGPVRPEGATIYNTTHNVMQYCNGLAWKAMGAVPGAGGGGCSNPSGSAGAMVFNTAIDTMQYCDGADWIAVGKEPPVGPTGCPTIGDKCTDGSIFAGDTNMYVTDVNQNTSIQWKASTGNNDINPDSLIDGAANHANVTVAINTLPAMDLCETLNRHGYQDWYLPARDELNVLYTNKAAIDANAMENFVASDYWSSSENGTSNAWVQRFSDGFQTSYNKSNTFIMRCVRRE